MIGLLLAMYPARWRTRYEEEFRAVLESRPLGPFDFADVLIGALDARLTRFRFAGAAGIEGGPLMMLRLGGVGAIAGGILWFAGITASSIDRTGDRAWVALFALGTFGLLLALVGLSAFQAHRHARLAWAAFAIPGIGALVSVVGLVRHVLRTTDEALIFGSLNAWSLWVIGLLACWSGRSFSRSPPFAQRSSPAEPRSARGLVAGYGHHSPSGLVGTNTATGT